MDAKTKANFINSVASGEGTPCPNCNAVNKPDSRFCVICGTKLVKPEPETDNSVPAFAQVTETKIEDISSTSAEPKPAFAQVTEAKTEDISSTSAEPAVAFAPVTETKVEPVKSTYVEPESVFAQGLPSWSIEPPQVMVRRHK